MKHELNDDLSLLNNGSKRLVSVLRGRKSCGQRFPPDLLVNLAASCCCRAKRINQYVINRHMSKAAIEIFFSVFCARSVWQSWLPTVHGESPGNRTRFSLRWRCVSPTLDTHRHRQGSVPTEASLNIPSAHKEPQKEGSQIKYHPAWMTELED